MKFAAKGLRGSSYTGRPQYSARRFRRNTFAWHSVARRYGYERDGQADLLVANPHTWGPEFDHEVLSPAASTVFGTHTRNRRRLRLRRYGRSRILVQARPAGETPPRDEGR